ncbi:MAG: response regulator [Roseburia sp.]|nr:response regulator [Roseburia sp.]MCM1277943.1 response regulator [Robinsoniella sp.]
MMEKVLLIGELGEIARSLNECLAEAFQVQLCPEQLENVRSMVKIIKPDLIIICQIGMEEINHAIFAWVHEKCPQTPVLGITTVDDWKQCREFFYKSEQFDVLFRPVTKETLLQKCYQLLGKGYGTEEKKKEGLKQKKKIMLVDDSALLLRKMKAMLEKQYDICLAKSGEQALKLIPREKPDLILLDYEMEGMDGRAAFEAMKQDTDMRFIPVVFLTSVDNRQSIYSVLQSKPDGYILKPPDEEKICATIAEILQVE